MSDGLGFYHLPVEVYETQPDKQGRIPKREKRQIGQGGFGERIYIKCRVGIWEKFRMDPIHFKEQQRRQDPQRNAYTGGCNKVPEPEAQPQLESTDAQQGQVGAAGLAWGCGARSVWRKQ